MSASFLKTEKLVLSTLTPVHVGSGEDYYPTNYVIDEGYLHYFGEMQLLEALPLNELNQLAGIAETRSGQDAIRQIQSFIFERRDRLRPFARHRVPVPEELQTFYQSRIGRTAQVEQGGRKFSNQLAIQRSTFNPHSQVPYIPGSSIKGAIRTALLDNLNKGERLRQVNDRKTNRQRPENSLELQQRLLDYENRHLEEDPFRLLKISDATYAHPDKLSGLEIRFALNRKRRRSDRPSSADMAGIPILLECLAANRASSFPFTLGINEGEPLESLRRKLKFRDFAELAGICNAFYRPQLEQELERLDTLGYADRDWLKQVWALLKGDLGQALEGGSALLLRLGRFGGAESKTLNSVRSIKILQGRDKPPRYQDEPTTLWLAADERGQQCGMLPLGWVLVEKESTQSAKTQAFLRSQAEAAYRNLASEQAMMAAAEAARLEREREAEQQRAKLAAEAAQEREASERLAAMTDNQRLIAKLLDSKGPGNKGQGPSGQLFNQARELAKQGASWNDVEKEALRQALVDVFAWLDVKKPKAKEVLRLLEAPLG